MPEVALCMFLFACARDFVCLCLCLCMFLRLRLCLCLCLCLCVCVCVAHTPVFALTFLLDTRGCI